MMKMKCLYLRMKESIVLLFLKLLSGNRHFWQRFNNGVTVIDVLYVVIGVPCNTALV